MLWQVMLTQFFQLLFPLMKWPGNGSILLTKERMFCHGETSVPFIEITLSMVHLQLVLLLQFKVENLCCLSEVNIPPTSVIVLDNALYHNKQKDLSPTNANRKNDIKRWLDEHNIEYDDKDIKKTLLEKVKQHRPAPLYLTDEAAHTQGHTVLKLPVAHCELNPIELA